VYAPEPIRETLASESPIVAASALFDTARRLAAASAAFVNTAPSEAGLNRATEREFLGISHEISYISSF